MPHKESAGTSVPTTAFSFLRGGGETGEYVRNFPWSSTAIGDPGQWPQSLSAAVCIVLSSSLPMLLAWGPEYLCFYNDAWSRLPRMAGQAPCIGRPGRDLPPDLWQTIAPAMTQVIATGAPVFLCEDPSVAVHGQYAYDCSPLPGEQGGTAGVLVIGTGSPAGNINARPGSAEDDSPDSGIPGQAPDPILVLKGEDMVLAFANEPFFKMWDLGREALGQPYPDMLPEARRQGLLEVLHDVYRNGTIHKDSEQPFVGAWGDGPGHTRYFNAVCQPYREKDGTVSGVLIMYSDVTEQVVTRKRLEESERRFRALVTATSGVVYRMNADWSEMWALEGRGFLTDTASPTADWISRYIHPKDQPRVAAAIQRAIHTKTTFQLEHEVLRADGTHGWISSRAVPMTNEAGTITDWFGAAGDITERMQIEEDLRIARDDLERSKRLYETITDNTPDLIYVFDLQYRFSYANNALLAMWGKSWDAAIGEGLRALGYEEWHAAMHEREIDQIVATRQPVRGTVTFPHAELGTRYYDYILTPVIGESGHVEAVAGTTRDVTDFKAAETALRESEERYRNLVETLERKVTERTAELIRSNEELQQFAHVASHDLKEPVRKIITFANMLKSTDGHALSEFGTMSLGKVIGSAERMMNMVNGVLTYSQLSASDELWEKIDLNRIIDNVEADLEVIIQQKNAVISRGRLPYISGAPVLVNQLFYNLVNNALKFNREGVPLRIGIAAEPAGTGWWNIAVSDNGIGFEPEYAESIFKTFTRLHAKDRYEGTGLGLSLCKRIVERHGGTISAAGRPGQGAIFRLLLPAAADQMEEK